MTTLTINYATPVALTWTPASVADGSYDGSASITNTVNKYIDAIVGGFITAGTGPSADNIISILAYGSWDGGTTFSAGVSGADGGTPDTGEENQLVLLAEIVVDGTSNHRYEYGPFSLAAMFGGVLPEDWGIILLNNSGVALNATAGNHEAKYTGIKYDSA